MRAGVVGSVLLALVLILASPARADRLVADLSDYLVSITSTFSGAEIFAFGMIDGATEPNGARPSIVIVLQGPPGPVTVRQKQRVGGIWINRDAETFEDVPGFVYVASSGPLETIADPRVLTRNQLGVDYVQVRAAALADDGARTNLFRNALIRRKAEAGLYIEDTTGVEIRARRLFRARIALPAQVPVGAYTATVYLLRAGRVVTAQTIPLYVERSDIEHMIHGFAHERPFLYGVFAVMIALAAGFGASELFRRS